MSARISFMRIFLHLLVFLFISGSLIYTTTSTVYAYDKNRASHNNESGKTGSSLLSLDSLKRLKEGVVEYKLSNGLTILFFKRDAAPIFSGYSAVRVGGVNEHEGKTGASHLFEHMAFKGSTVIGTKDYEQEMELLPRYEELRQAMTERELTENERAELSGVYQKLESIWDVAEYSRLFRLWGGGQMNATTSKEITDYFGSFPVTSFEFWCWAESERLLRPVMRQFYKERDVVLEERRMRYENSPSGKLYERLISEAFTVHPYKHPVIGYKEDIQGLNPEDLRELHRKYYVGSNIVVSIVGDLEFDAILPIIKKYFGRFPSGPRPKDTIPEEPPQTGERQVRIKHDSSPIFYMGYRKPIFPDPDEPAISLFLEYLIGHRVAPLYKRIVVDKKLSSSLGYFEAPGQSYPNLVMIYGEPIVPYTNEIVLEEFDQGLAEYANKPVTEEELNITKRKIMKGALTQMRSNLGLASSLGGTHQKFGSWKAALEWYEQLLAVTSSDVMRVGKKYFQKERRTVGFLSRKG